MWIVRDVKTKGIPFFMVTSVRSGGHVLVVLVNMSRVEEIAMRVFRRRVDKVIYLHDRATATTPPHGLTWDMRSSTRGITQNKGLKRLHQWTSTFLGILTSSLGGYQHSS